MQDRLYNLLQSVWTDNPYWGRLILCLGLPLYVWHFLELLFRCTRSEWPDYYFNFWWLIAGLLLSGLLVFVEWVLNYSQRDLHLAQVNLFLKQQTPGLPLVFLLLFFVALPGFNLVYFGIFALTSLLIPSSRGLLACILLVMFTGVAVIVSALFLGVYTPNMHCGDARLSLIKANMHKYQAMVETYAVDHQGLYPKNTGVLEKQAEASNYSYWKNFENPLKSPLNLTKPYADITAAEIKRGPKISHLKPEPIQQYSFNDYVGIRIYWPRQREINRLLGVYPPAEQFGHAGQVLYLRPEPNRYLIYGVNANQELVNDKGRVFVLSNE